MSSKESDAHRVQFRWKPTALSSLRQQHPTTALSGPLIPPPVVIIAVAAVVAVAAAVVVLAAVVVVVTVVRLEMSF